MKLGLSRRKFLKGAGVTAAGAAIGDAGLGAFARQDESGSDRSIVGPGPIKVSLNVNGADKSVEIEPRTTLADALRLNLDMTGTKVVCDRGACSACTVFIDDTPMLACMTLAIDCRNRKITTIEGLASGDQLHPIQQKFIEHDALQCGFCTPGMVMSCAALLERNKSPDLAAIKTAVSGNLCRCGTYPKVFEAVLAVSKQA